MQPKHVAGRRQLVLLQAKRLAQHPFDGIARNGKPRHTLAHHQTQTRLFGRSRMKRQQLGATQPFSFEGRCELIC